MPKKNSIVFHNRSNFENHFIIKQLAKVFEKQFTCLGENTEKKHNCYSSKKKSQELKKWRRNYKKIFINGARFMASISSNLINNLSESEGVHIIKCKFGYNDKRCETCGNKFKYCNCFLKCIYFKDDLIECKRLCFSKSHQSTQVWWKVKRKIV